MRSMQSLSMEVEGPNFVPIQILHQNLSNHRSLEIPYIKFKSQKEACIPREVVVHDWLRLSNLASLASDIFIRSEEIYSFPPNTFQTTKTKHSQLCLLLAQKAQRWLPKYIPLNRRNRRRKRRNPSVSESQKLQ